MVWFMHEEKDKRILHGRNGKEHQMPEPPDICVDDLCKETEHGIRGLGGVIKMAIRA